MKLPQYSRIAIEELPKEVQKWISLITDPVNSFMLTVKNGLNNGLTVTDNRAGGIKTASVVNGASEFSYKASTQPKAVTIGRVTDLTVSGEHPANGIGLVWSYTGSTIKCTFYGLTVGHTYDITLVIFDN